MLCKLYENASNCKHFEIDPEYFALDSLDTVSDGVVVRKSVVKPRSVAKEFNGFSCHDFDISTIISTGSETLLRPCQFRNTDVASIGDAMIKVIQMFETNEKVV